MPRVPRDGEKKCSRASAGVSPNPDLNPNVVQTDGKIDLAHISNILECAIDVLGNDNTKLASLETLLKTVLEKVAQKKKIFLPLPTTRSRQKLTKRSSSTSSLAVPKTCYSSILLRLHSCASFSPFLLTMLPQNGGHLRRQQHQ